VSCDALSCCIFLQICLWCDHEWRLLGKGSVWAYFCRGQTFERLDQWVLCGTSFCFCHALLTALQKMTLHYFLFQWFHRFAGVCLGFHSMGLVPRFTRCYQLSSIVFAHRRGHQDVNFLLPRSTAWDPSWPSSPRCSTRTRPCKTLVRPIIQEYWAAGRTHLALVVEKIHLASLVGDSEGVC
jgi:hypothetical protein